MRKVMYVVWLCHGIPVLFILTFLSLPELDRCQVHNPGLVDLLLKRTYKNIPRLPRYWTYCILLLFSCILILF